MSQQIFAEIMNTMQAEADESRAQKSQQYLQAQPGGYGYPDQFLGLTNPQVRKVAKQYRQVAAEVVQQLWLSPVHEVRLLATIIINEQYKRQPQCGTEYYQLYVQYPEHLNNWDLVDTLGPHFLGNYLYAQQASTEIWRLANSANLFEQRMAVIAQFAWLRAGDDRLLYALATYFLSHEHDLIHKAVGWLLREAGKRNLSNLVAFLDQNTAKMPRTMLRYAIEKFPQAQRQAYLAIKRQ